MKEFHIAIFFTKAPLGGYYRYKDEFQIFSCDMENMPVSKLQKYHTNILEFWTTEDEIIKTDFEFEELQEQMDKTAMVILTQDKILALLTAFTNNLFFKYTLRVNTL